MAGVPVAVHLRGNWALGATAGALGTGPFAAGLEAGDLEGAAGLAAGAFDGAAGLADGFAAAVEVLAGDAGFFSSGDLDLDSFLSDSFAAAASFYFAVELTVAF